MGRGYDEGPSLFPFPRHGTALLRRLLLARFLAGRHRCGPRDQALRRDALPGLEEQCLEHDELNAPQVYVSPAAAAPDAGGRGEGVAEDARLDLGREPQVARLSIAGEAG